MVAPASFVRRFAGLAFALALLSPGGAAAAESPTRYQAAPAEIRAVLDAPAPPTFHVSPTAGHVLFTRTLMYPPIAELAAPMLKLAGVRIDPDNNARHG